MNHPQDIYSLPEQAINPPDGKEWPQYQLQDAKERALREIFKGKDARDLIADLVTDTSSYKDGCDFWNVICSMIIAETDKQKLDCHDAIFQWAMNQSDKAVTAIAEMNLAEDEAYNFNEARDE